MKKLFIFGMGTLSAFYLISKYGKYQYYLGFYNGATLVAEEFDRRTTKLCLKIKSEQYLYEIENGNRITEDGEQYFA